MSASQRKRELLAISTHPPDFTLLASLYPSFHSQYFLCSLSPGRRLDFSNPSACKALTQACLQHYLCLRYWDLPLGFLCPPLPQRVNYVKWIRELVGGKQVTVLDM